MRNPEQHEILGAFADLLAGPTGDGQQKRAAGIKPLWKDDSGHRDAFYRHLGRIEQGERYDSDSGSPSWVHVAWRALALAYQQMVDDGRSPG